MNKILAKSNPEITLLEHSKNNAELFVEIATMSGMKEDDIILGYLTCLLHDVGKCTKNFQEYLFTNSDYHLSHNVAGAHLGYNLIRSIEIGNKDRFFDAVGIVLSSILYHHPKPSFTDLDLFEDSDIDTFFEYMKEVEDVINTKFPNKVHICYNRDVDIESIKSDVDIPFLYKEGFFDNELNFCIRNLVIPCDVAVSICEKTNENPLEYLKKKVNRPIEIDFEKDVIKPNFYDERFYKQKEYASQLFNSGSPVNLINASTGFGKTAVGTMFLLCNNRKGWWVSPDNTLAYSAYKGIKTELKNLNLLDKVSLGLYLQGEMKEGTKDADILVTNIDNLFAPVNKSKPSTLFDTFSVMYSNCVFDEFHEYSQIHAINKAFCLTCLSRKKYTPDSHILLMSATPSKHIDLFGIKEGEKNCIVYKDPKSLQKKYRIHFTTKIPNVKEEGYLICANSVKTCQEFYKKGCVDRLNHAKYIVGDLERNRELLYKEHGKEGNDFLKSYIATSILGVGVDVSFPNMVIVNPLPISTKQSIGRDNRWCEDIISELYLCSYKSNSEQFVMDIEYIEMQSKGKMSKLKKNTELSDEFVNFLKTKFNEDDIITEGQFLDAIDEFLVLHKNEMDTIFNKTLQFSQNSIKKLRYRYCNEKSNDDMIFINNHEPNLRSDYSDNIFVKLKDYNTKEYIDEVIQVSLRLIEDKDDDFYLESLKDFKNNTDILKSKHYDNVRSKGILGIFSYLKNKAICNQTPFFVPSEIYYDSVLGIIEEKK